MHSIFPSTCSGTSEPYICNLLPGKKALRRRHRLTAAIVSALASICPVGTAMSQSATQNSLEGSVPPKEASFDIETLKSRNIDPKLADYFRNAARFTEGTNTVTLLVNGTKLGLVDATFDAQGKLCFNRNILEKARLRIPLKFESPSISNPKLAGICYAFEAAYPATQITLNSAQNEVELLVPTESILLGGHEVDGYSSGGTAALFNYDILGQTSASNGQTTRFLYVSTELGGNVGDWIVRSRQLYTSNNGQTSFTHLYAFAQRSFPRKQAILQVGQININSPLFAGGPITGLQVIPEQALAVNGSRPAIEGVAQSEARVDVRQAGVLIYSTRVPAGPFALSDVPILNGRTDLSVTVIEANGAERQFVVPIAALNASGLPSTGYSFAAGQIRDISDIGSRQPIVATASGSWAYGRRIVGSSGLLAGNGYQAAAVGVDSRVTNTTYLSAHGTFSNASGLSVRGTQGVFAITSILSDAFSLGASATLQSVGYRDLLDTTYNEPQTYAYTRYKTQYTGTVGWSNPMFGGFNLAYSSLKSFNGLKSQRLVTSWGKTFRRVSVNASLELFTGSPQLVTANNGNAFYLSANVPLGTRNIRAYVNQRDGDMRSGVEYNERVSDALNYRVSAENSNSSTDVSANVAFIPRYTQVNLSYGRYGTGTSSVLGEVSGGLIFHNSSLTASPYPIQDTFGVISVGDLVGVKVTTPYGPVWTDYSGKAVIPGLSAYQSNRVEVDTKTLPRNVDIKNGFETIDAGRGSVNDVKFEIVKTRRVLITVVDDRGHLLEKGAAVLTPDNTYVTTVVDGGQIFIPNAGTSNTLKVAMPDGNECRLTVELPKKANTTAYYERATATCKIN